MWVTVKKPFGLLKVGDSIELKGGDNHQSLIDSGHIEESKAPKKDEVNPVTTGAYSTDTVLTEGKHKAPKKEDKK